MNAKLSTNLKFKRMLVNILSIFVILAMAFPVTGSASAQETVPHFYASAAHNGIWGADFVPGAQLTFSIYDAVGGNLLWSGDKAADSSGQVWLGGGEHAVDLVPGYQIVISIEGTPIKDLMLEAITADVFDLDQGLLQGTAPAGRNLWVGVDFDTTHLGMEVTTDPETGVWIADFDTTVPSTYTWSGAQLFDNDGDATEANPPRPTISISTSNNYLRADQFTPDALVTFTVYATPNPGESPLWSDSRITDENGFAIIWPWEQSLDLVIGNYVIVTDGINEKQLMLEAITLGVFDPDADFLAGTAPTAPEGRFVWVWAGNGGNGCGMGVTADPVNGAWAADFTTQPCDITADMEGAAHVYDEDGDVTVFHQGPPPPLPSPWSISFPENDAVEGWEWPDGATVTLTINNAPGFSWSGTAAVTTWGDPRTYVRIEFGNDYNLQVGDVVTLTDELGTSTTHTVQNLSVTEVNAEADTVAGMADDNAVVQIWPHGYDQDFFIEDTVEDGAWLADFGTLGFHTIEETGGRSQIMVDGNATAVDWNAPPPPPNPRFTVFPEWEWFDGYDWPDEGTVAIRVEDKPECATEGGSSGNFFNGPFPEGCDLKVGDVVTFSHGMIIRTHTVRNLAVSGVDEATDTVTGTSDPYETVFVWQHEPGEQIPVEANENGEWLADLSGYYDIRPGLGGRSEIRDGEGNATAVDWNAPEPPPNPFIAVSLTEHWFWVNNFAPETVVTFSIYENQGDESPILEFSKPTDAFGNLTIDGWAHIWDPEAGDYIVATDGLNTKDLVLEYITLDVFDPGNDLVSGQALPGREVGVGVGNETGEQWMNVIADESTGLWVADFTLEGFEFDITEDSWAGGHVNDEDGDVTTAHNSGPPEPPAWLTAFPEQDAVEAWDWPLGAVVHLAIDDPTTEESPDYEQDATVTFAPWGSWQLWVWFDFAGLYDMKAGDIVTLSYGDTVRTHTVQNLSITTVEQGDDTVKGIADPGAEVHVWPYATGQDQLAIAKTKGQSMGKWNVDFSGIFDLAPGECGRSEIYDEFGNRTAVDWCVPNPHIIASITEDWFYLVEFAPEANLELSIYNSQGGSLIWQGTRTADVNGFAWIDAEGWDLLPGNYLVVSDGNTTKDLIIEGFTFDVFDLTNGHLEGTAPEPFGRRVWVGIGWENDGWSMDVSTSEQGAWTADFDASVPSDYQWVAAQIFDDDGDASELRPDRVVDFWVAAYTYDYGTWSEGEHSYHFEAEWNSGSETSNPVSFEASEEAQPSDGYALLRPGAVRAGEGCEAIDAIQPGQATRFLAGYVTEYPVTYSEALDYFDSLSASAVWDDGQSAELVRDEIIPFREDDWFNYVCTFTADLILDASQPDWVNSRIPVSAGQSFTIEAFGLMNPCSDTYPNGADYCIFYTPLGAEGVVPYENEFGIFPGPGLRFMALLGRIDDGEPFYVGAGGTFTAEQTGTLWFTPNDNLRTDNQGTYRVLVWLEP